MSNVLFTESCALLRTDRTLYPGVPVSLRK